MTFSDLSLLESYVSFFCDDKELSQLTTMIDVIRPREIVYCATSLSQKDLRYVYDVVSFCAVFLIFYKNHQSD